MHCSNKKRKDPLTPDEIKDWYDQWPYYDYEDCCDYNCSCWARSLSEYEEFYSTIAEAVADIIIKQQNLNADIKPVLVEERMDIYTAWIGENGGYVKLNSRVKEDIAFIWPHIKDTDVGFELFSQVFGQNTLIE